MGSGSLKSRLILTALELLLKRAGAHRRLAIENEWMFPRQPRRLPECWATWFTGQTPAMQEIFALIRQVAPTSAAVLITGESGTGKELAWRALLHANSKRSSGPFVWRSIAPRCRNH